MRQQGQFQNVSQIVLKKVEKSKKQEATKNDKKVRHFGTVPIVSERKSNEKKTKCWEL